MSAQIIDGKLVADAVRDEARSRAQGFLQRHGRKPCLQVVLVGDDPASHVYVRNKEKASQEAGFAGGVHRLVANCSQAELLDLVGTLNADAHVDGILVQMPLPPHLDSDAVIASIDYRKDVDGLTAMNAGLLALGRKGLVPCTPLGSMRLLKHIGYDVAGKHAVVVGRSNLVGKPIAQLLLQQNATVTLAHSKTRALDEVVRQADVVVAAVGRKWLVKGDWIKPGAVVIDVGINRGEDGKLYGDVDFAAASERASFITPVPGGVGRMTVAMLLMNTLDAGEARLAGL